tara:strand:- start:29 stop:913 length:885 start_codon:yes stop_codon:yes gene_type:complete
MRFAVDLFLAAASLATCGAQFCGRQACSAIPSPAVATPSGTYESVNCTKPTTCCTGGTGRAAPSNIAAVDLSALKGLVIPGTDYDGNEYQLEMCAAATPRVGCMRGVLNGSAQYSTLLWRQAQRNEVHSCQELGSYEVSNCECLARPQVKNTVTSYVPVPGPIYPPALLNASCGQQYIGTWLGEPSFLNTPKKWKATAGWSTNNLDDGPLTFTIVSGNVITPSRSFRRFSTTISFECNPESVIPQEPFVYEPYIMGSTIATITIYTSVVCANGGTELREYQKRADRARHIEKEL